MSEENSKYQQIILTAKDLFWKYGVKRVSVEEICREAGVSKMTFYKFFPNKKELAIAIIQRFVGNLAGEFKEMVKSKIPFEEKISKMFLIKYRATENISSEFITDVYKNPELEIHVYMEKIGGEVLKDFVAFLKDSQKKGLIRNDIKPEFILAYQNQLSNMMEDVELMKKYKEPSEFIMEAMRFLFYGIITPKGKDA